MSNFHFLPTSHLRVMLRFLKPVELLRINCFPAFQSTFFKVLAAGRNVALYCGYWVLMLMKQIFLLSERIQVHPLVLRKVLPACIIPGCSSLWLFLIEKEWINVFFLKPSNSTVTCCVKKVSPVCSSVLFYWTIKQYLIKYLINILIFLIKYLIKQYILIICNQE